MSDVWGFDRGTPLDRHYIEGFLAGCGADVRGRVLEVQDSSYTDRFGSEVTGRDVLDIDPANPRATIVADLADPTRLPGGAFDCFILTQTLHLVYDVHAAIRGCHHVLRPGGVLLVTGPAVSRVRSGDYWRFTPSAMSRLLEEAFGEVTVRGYGNVLAATAFLSGMATEEVPKRLLDDHDEHFPVIVAARAVKA
ncbi:class I SAM-dependent methyltransferase [Geodermatophilus sp. CPCC 205761]|uniref:class I SAM-dependent methyltransferase n=1 Tax=Geodermatophilus sp. CPCC 205761 TaxID=2936597 RepID=UPI003EE9D484